MPFLGRAWRLAVAAVWLLWVPCLPAQTQVSSSLRTYVLVEESLLDVETERGGLFGFLGHDHLVRAREFDGTIRYDPDDPATSSVEITIFADALEVLTPAGSDDLAEIDVSMREQVLRVDEYPMIHVVSRRVESRDEGVRVTADLTLVGVTREIMLDVDLVVDGDTLRATGDFEVKQRDFGIEPFSKVGGAVKVKDEITFRLDAVAVATAPNRR